MPGQADFTILLKFRGMGLGSTEPDDFARSIRSLANDYAQGAMCSEWREKWQREETEVVIDQLHEPHFETYTVRLNVGYEATVRVRADGDGDSGYDRAQEWASDIPPNVVAPALTAFGVEFTEADESMTVEAVDFEGDWDGESPYQEVSP